MAVQYSTLLDLDDPLLGTVTESISIFNLGQKDYLPTQQRMQELASLDKAERPNQIWLLEHPAVYTQGTSCEQQTLLSSDIPVVKSDRGGQITYHGPGQIVMYPLLNLRQLNLGIKNLVHTLEQAVIDVLRDFGVSASRLDNAPGVYVGEAKVAALGLRVKNGLSYHGLSFNYSMDLSPFSNIDPCGMKGLKVAQLRDLIDPKMFESTQKQAVGLLLANRFIELLSEMNDVS